MNNNKSKLGIIAGSGLLPHKIIESCKKSGREYFILAIQGDTPEELVKGNPHAWVRLAAIGSALKALKNENVKEVVLAGKIKRPSFTGMIPDLVGAKLLARITAAKVSGDDSLLKLVINFIEEQGYKIIGAHEAVPELLAGKGVLGKIQPPKKHHEYIEAGVGITREIGKLDIGQSIIMQAGNVIAVEAAEGTDEMIKRSKAYINSAEKAILVKTMKPNQEARVDMPTIGVDTVTNCHNNGIAGIVIESGKTIMLEKKRTIEAADKCGIFVVGV